MTKSKRYLKSYRLADVFALIQVLAFDVKAKRSVNGIESELQGKPKSAQSWKDIALEHPEFFRINKKEYEMEKDNANAICLIVRHVKNDVLTSEMTTKFFETAIELHEKEHEKADKWKVWLPLLIALISIVSSFVIQYTNSREQKNLTRYQNEFKPKQESYANFMRAVSQSYDAALQNNSKELISSLDQVENNFYIFEPFLNENIKDTLWSKYQMFSNFCYTIQHNDSLKFTIENSTEAYLSYKKYFREKLYSSLFSH
jgi:hypothetical protein